MLIYAEKFGHRIAVYDTILKKELVRKEFPFKQIKAIDKIYAQGSSYNIGIVF